MRYLVNAIENNSTEFEADGRVLRLKQYLGINMRPPVIDAILTALEKNTLVEALYIQNFEEVRGGKCQPRIGRSSLAVGRTDAELSLGSI